MLRNGSVRIEQDMFVVRKSQKRIVTGRGVEMVGSELWRLGELGIVEGR